MKRLCVRTEFRGKQIGSLLIEKIIDDARKIGYSQGNRTVLQVRDTFITESWGSGTGTAEWGMVYIWMVITAWVGFTIAWYFWSLRGGT